MLLSLEWMVEQVCPDWHHQEVALCLQIRNVWSQGRGRRGLDKIIKFYILLQHKQFMSK